MNATKMATFIIFPIQQESQNLKVFILADPAQIPTISNIGNGITENINTTNTGCRLKERNILLFSGDLISLFPVYPKRYPINSPVAVPRLPKIITIIGFNIIEYCKITIKPGAGNKMLAVDAKQAKNTPKYPVLENSSISSLKRNAETITIITTVSPTILIIQSRIFLSISCSYK